ncbi:hypothetical protein UG55_1007117 [Frankia sp. EI5c]|uniref:hypothetical protein n=1 Tax=Frankia sp. EI5c TaxID=683316 RepID=UPI0007C31FCC|nr:hypothetical protein [Frankia sp. EI5c]OAA27789.1 hypothetical protein UG55_1007117 [Frankia sp. EI5c]
MAGLIPPADVRRLLAMVDASGRRFAPEEHEDFFDDYADIVTGNGALPVFDPGRSDDAATGVLDVDVFLGIGLAVLGQIALRVLAALEDLAADGTVSGVTLFARRLFRRGPVDPHDPSAGTETDQARDAATEAKVTVDVVAGQLTEQVRVALPTALAVDAAQLQLIVTVQIQALADPQVPRPVRYSDDA